MDNRLNNRKRDLAAPQSFKSRIDSAPPFISAPNNLPLNPRGLLPLPSPVNPTLSFAEALVNKADTLPLPRASGLKVNLMEDSRKISDGKLTLFFIPDLEALSDSLKIPFLTPLWSCSLVFNLLILFL
ncbi:hypothetical protein O6H91_Y425900 [Diphasiastrum complanatum]|nr:hypothetical protein O6H91_Y425900 [Diphasiastrum complanatum]